MHDSIIFALGVAQGPLFRFAFALMAFGLLRLALLGLSDIIAAYVMDRRRAAFWRKLRLHALWWIFPSMVVARVRPLGSQALYAYHMVLGGTALLFRTLVIVLPAFMVAHVYLWERGLGVSWPSFPGRVADVLSVVTIVSGVVLFFGRVYSPVLRAIEPPWSFFKPLLVLVPFLTGTLARHPTWSPLDYHAMLFLHVLSAAIVLALLPFARLLSGMHTRPTTLVPSAAWRTGSQSAGLAGAAASEV